MPQMAPLWWSTLMIMFILSYLLMLIFNYFLIFPKPSMKYSLSPKNYITWKW